MWWQLAVVALIVVAATAYLARRTWRTWGRRGSGCGGACGSGCKSQARPNATPLIPLQQLMVRNRRRE